MTRTDILASFLAKVCNDVGSGQLADVCRGVLFLRAEHRGPDTPAIVLTYPIQSDAETIAELEAAIAWLRQDPGGPPPITHPPPETTQ